MIRTILFDMGNVLVHFSHRRMWEQMAEVAGVDGETMRRRLFDDELQNDLERGRLSPEEFHREVAGENHATVGVDRLRIAASDIFTLNEPMPALLDALREAGVRLVLLSNTSVWHFDWVRKHYDVLECFDDYVTSFTAGAIKPEPGIFEAALSRIECDPAECFYTDDVPEYVAAGREFGLQAELFEGATELRRHLAARDVSVTP